MRLNVLEILQTPEEGRNLDKLVDTNEQIAEKFAGVCSHERKADSEQKMRRSMKMLMAMYTTNGLTRT